MPGRVFNVLDILGIASIVVVTRWRSDKIFPAVVRKKGFCRRVLSGYSLRIALVAFLIFHLSVHLTLSPGAEGGIANHLHAVRINSQLPQFSRQLFGFLQRRVSALALVFGRCWNPIAVAVVPSQPEPFLVQVTALP